MNISKFLVELHICTWSQFMFLYYIDAFEVPDNSAVVSLTSYWTVYFVKLIISGTEPINAILICDIIYVSPDTVPLP